jgi:hypothetical protein
MTFILQLCFLILLTTCTCNFLHHFWLFPPLGKLATHSSSTGIFLLWHSTWLVLWFVISDPEKRLRGSFAYIGLLIMLVCAILFALNLLQITNLWAGLQVLILVDCEICDHYLIYDQMMCECFVWDSI